MIGYNKAIICVSGGLYDFEYNPARIKVSSIARMKQDIKGIISPMYICFKCNEKIIPEYLEYFLSHLNLHMK